jgi:predicted nucleic acid-binding protein
MTVVSNSSPLIALARINQFDLLRQLYSEVILPLAVQDEVERSGRSRPGGLELSAADWIRVVAVTDRTAVSLLRQQLDYGESAAIALVLELSADLLLIDEARGRRIAQARGVAHVGTIGIVVAAKRQNLIPSATTLLDDLRTVGFRMSQRLYDSARAIAGEL